MSSIGALKPAVDVRADEFTADNQHQCGGTSVMPSSSATKLGAEAGKRQRAAPPLDDHLDDIARQHEHQRRQASS